MFEYQEFKKINIPNLAVNIQPSHPSLFAIFDLVTDKVWRKMNIHFSFRMVSDDKFRALVMYPTCPGRTGDSS